VISAIKSLLTANTYRRSLTAVSPLSANHATGPFLVPTLLRGNELKMQLSFKSRIEGKMSNYIGRNFLE
ncbi:hypothetical protein BZJ19_04270, partial [Salinivibrio proteolyticus]